MVAVPVETVQAVVRPFRKTANPTAISTLQQAANQQLQRHAGQQLQKVLLTSLGVGLAGRGAWGLAQLLHRNLAKPVQPASARPVPLPMLYEQEPKQAGVAGDFLQGRHATTLQGVPWFMPAAVGAGIGGLSGGWKLMDYLLDKRRQGDVDQDLEAAKREYEAALLAGSGKQAAAADELGQELEGLCDDVEKQASDLAGQIAGGYGTYALLSALVAGLMAHQYGQKRQTRRVLERAQTARRRERAAQAPAPLMALPLPKPAVKPTPKLPSLPRSLRSAPGGEDQLALDKEPA